MRVTLSKDEFDLLSKAQSLAEHLRAKVLSAPFGGRTYAVDVSNEEASLIREACGDELQISGFDAQGEPTRAGLLLESMIDKFFTGPPAGL